MKFEGIDLEYDVAVSIIGIFSQEDEDSGDYECCETDTIPVVDFLFNLQTLSTVSTSSLAMHLLANPETFVDQYKRFLETLFIPYLSEDDQKKVKRNVANREYTVLPFHMS